MRGKIRQERRGGGRGKERERGREGGRKEESDVHLNHVLSLHLSWFGCTLSPCLPLIRPFEYTAWSTLVPAGAPVPVRVDPPPPGAELSGYFSCANRKIAEPEKPRHIRERETGCRQPAGNCFSCPYLFMVLRGISGNRGMSGKVGSIHRSHETMCGV